MVGVIDFFFCPGTPGKLFPKVGFPGIPRLHQTEVFSRICHKLPKSRVGLISPDFPQWNRKQNGRKKTFSPLGYFSFFSYYLFKDFLFPFIHFHSSVIFLLLPEAFEQ